MINNTKLSALIFVIILIIYWFFVRPVHDIDTTYAGYERCTIFFNNGEGFRNIPLADTQARISQGLSFNKNPQGMLFKLKENVEYGFWMKDTLKPLSIAFINSKLEIIDIYDMKPNETTRVSPSKPASFALEVTLGSFESLSITTSNKIQNINCYELKG